MPMDQQSISKCHKECFVLRISDMSTMISWGMTQQLQFTVQYQVGVRAMECGDRVCLILEFLRSTIIKLTFNKSHYSQGWQLQRATPRGYSWILYNTVYCCTYDWRLRWWSLVLLCVTTTCRVCPLIHRISHLGNCFCWTFGIMSQSLYISVTTSKIPFQIPPSTWHILTLLLACVDGYPKCVGITGMYWLAAFWCAVGRVWPAKPWLCLESVAGLWPQMVVPMYEYSEGIDLGTSADWWILALWPADSKVQQLQKSCLTDSRTDADQIYNIYIYTYIYIYIYLSSTHVHIPGCMPCYDWQIQMLARRNLDPRSACQMEQCFWR